MPHDEDVKREKNEKAKEAFANAFKKASDMGKKTVDGIHKRAEAISKHTKENIHNYQMNKYKPLTEKEFKSENFNIPNVIEIVDDAVRRDIVVCEGAIGWIETHKNVEVLHLYDEYIEESGLQFVPVGTCDNIYYVDAFDRNRFINVNCIFAKSTEEKLAELEHIAYSLGAKTCSVEIIEFNEETDSRTVKAKINEPISSASIEATHGYSSKKANKQSGKAISYFAGHNNPTKPNLKWFAHDDSIKLLIKMRCTDKDSIKSRMLELKSASSATMSVKVACAIDKILKGSISMEKQAIREHNSRLLFEVEF